VAMRPKTKASELPSSHNVGVYIHNECVRWLKQLWKEIIVSTQEFGRQNGILTAKYPAAPGKVSMTADGWSADNTKASFLGVTAHWIEVKGEKWML
jgi:hypothetical protein